MTEIPLAALLPAIVLALLFIAFCLTDVFRGSVRYLPKWAWAVICCISVPLGGVVYLIVGRGRSAPRETAC